MQQAPKFGRRFVSCSRWFPFPDPVAAVFVLPVRHHLLVIGVLMASLVTATAVADDDTPDQQHDDTPDLMASSTERPDRPSAFELNSTTRNQELIQRARDEQWSPDRLFEHLQLDDTDDCQDFADRAYLRERHARWREAIALLARIDLDALHDWLLGLEQPPQIPTEETQQQLRCLVSGLIGAVDDDSYEIRLLLNLTDHFDDRFHSVRQLGQRASQSDYWLDRTTRALTRSTYRNIYGQASIWNRKFRFGGRAFNRISDDAARRCSLTHNGLWRPANRRHRHCWHSELSSSQREQEILQASAAPGLSRHHWGTDVDILSLNPVNFRDGGPLYDDWRWLDEYALDYGFFQTYGSQDVERAHMEERWHWSYYPVGQALWDYIYYHDDLFEEAIFEQWDHFEDRWASGPGPYFEHMREHWRDYLFNIDIPIVRPDTSSDAFHRPPVESPN